MEDRGSLDVEDDQLSLSAVSQSWETAEKTAERMPRYFWGTQMVIFPIIMVSNLHLWRRRVILTSGDGVQMSVLSFGTTLLKHSLPEMVIFPNKTSPFPWSLVVDPWNIGVILTSGDGVQMSVSSFGKTWYVAWNYTRLEWIHSSMVWIHSRLDQTRSDFQTFGSTAQPMMQIWKKFFHILTSNC